MLGDGDSSEGWMQPKKMAPRASELLADGFFLLGSAEGDAFAGVGDFVGCPELEGTHEDH